MEDRLFRAAKMIFLIVAAMFMVEVCVLLPKLVNHAERINMSMEKIHRSISSSANDDP